MPFIHLCLFLLKTLYCEALRQKNFLVLFAEILITLTFAKLTSCLFKKKVFCCICIQNKHKNKSKHIPVTFSHVSDEFSLQLVENKSSFGQRDSRLCLISCSVLISAITEFSMKLFAFNDLRSFGIEILGLNFIQKRSQNYRLQNGEIAVAFWFDNRLEVLGTFIMGW